MKALTFSRHKIIVSSYDAEKLLFSWSSSLYLWRNIVSLTSLHCSVPLDCYKNIHWSIEKSVSNFFWTCLCRLNAVSGGLVSLSFGDRSD